MDRLQLFVRRMNGRQIYVHFSLQQASRRFRFVDMRVGLSTIGLNDFFLGVICVDRDELDYRVVVALV